ncbi:TetR/AcrR family transcriptional regulator [Desertivirga arenae]|uniref:TetR/AcrR family transcriptional regulator n=1 Tax=Desertivirga arenae TaxID=2810309 RepID=UPI001A961E80|nr:TetR/AcrR family transcriptional regulator [Pedobacter sp. SYSU D00823]
MMDFKQSRNKDLTMARLIETVGEIFIKDGVKGLGLNNIARKAGYDKNLINRYFGSRDGLLDAYIADRDYWIKYKNEIRQSINNVIDIKNYPLVVATILKNQFNYYYENKEAQLIILAEICGEEEELLQSIARVRELLGEDIFEKIDPIFIKSGLNIRTVMALLTAGIYYLILHAINNGSTFCGVDINTKEGRDSVEKGIDWVVDLVFKATGLF